MSQHDEKRPLAPTPPSTQPPPEDEPPSGNVYKFAALFFGVPLILLIVMVLMSN